MTGSTATAPQDQAEARPSSGGIAWTVLRVVGSVKPSPATAWSTRRCGAGALSEIYAQ
jgi:hypothetical protein